MPKIFLIKNRLHQQQLRLLESQNLIQAKNEDRLNIGDSAQDQDDREPLSLVAKKRNTEDNSGTSEQNADDFHQRSGEFAIRELQGNCGVYSEAETAKNFFTYQESL